MSLRPQHEVGVAEDDSVEEERVDLGVDLAEGDRQGDSAEGGEGAVVGGRIIHRIISFLTK